MQYYTLWTNTKLYELEIKEKENGWRIAKIEMLTFAQWA